ncbi:hypothetical protein Scep_008052 [Stephania cephalantha]|uniref:Mitogen-activated protein kinase kinase kinase 1 n=1 Tax=Stephania cephalantha TaxID=152367 RepID=A0AAP0KDQ1_9MAGN
MESISSNSPSIRHRSRPMQPITDRIVRALHHRLRLLHRSPLAHNGSDTNFINSIYAFSPIADRIVRALHHHLRLLHRSASGSDFYVLGATGNVYTVTLSTAPSCSCPDRTVPCKHILFVFLRVLGLSLNDTCLRRRTLRPCQLDRLLGARVSPETLAGARTREKFHELFSQMAGVGPPPPRRKVELEDGATCPVCLEEMVAREGDGSRTVVACGTCRNPVHVECLLTWRRSRGRRAATCVICRAKWRDFRAEQEKYLNLASFVDEEDRTVDDQGVCGN